MIRALVVAVCLIPPLDAFAQEPTPAADTRCAECTAQFLQALTAAAQAHAACMQGAPAPAVIPAPPVIRHTACPPSVQTVASDDTLLKLVALLEQRREKVAVASDADEELRRQLLLYRALFHDQPQQQPAWSSYSQPITTFSVQPRLRLVRGLFGWRWRYGL